MYFIIIHSINFKYFLPVNKKYIKGENKVSCIIICYFEPKIKNYKIPIKQLNADVQVK